jgi:hypothetical protein
VPCFRERDYEVRIQVLARIESWVELKGVERAVTGRMLVLSNFGAATRVDWSPRKYKYASRALYPATYGVPVEDLIKEKEPR